MHITELADADGHIIEPGDLWVERLPRDLREIAPRFYRDEEGRFHQCIYGIDIQNLDVMYGGIRPSDMLQSMGLACAMGMPLDRVFASDERERFTILDAPRWALDGRERLAFNTENKVGRAVLFPTFMLSGGTFLPHLAAALPTIDVEASVAEVRRTAAMGVRVAFIRTNPVHGMKYSDRSFDPLWQA